MKTPVRILMRLCFSFRCIILLLLIIACSKEENKSVILDSTTVSYVSNNSATITSKLSSIDGTVTVNQHGHCWGAQSDPDIIQEHTSLGTLSSGKSFTSDLTDLEPGITYYVRPYATVDDVPAYGSQISFTTTALPVVITKPVTAVTENTASIGGEITSTGATEVTACGVCWNNSSNPTIEDNVASGTIGTAVFECELAGLTKSTIYYVKAYATNSYGTAYGQEVSFITLPIVFSVGQSWGGGIIFYVDSTGQHGFISATLDQGKASWGCNETFLGGTSTGLGTGKANTDIILSGCSEGGTAARICKDLVLNGYSDWFLPSRDELYMMYEQRNVIGGFKVDNYWSSSETNATFAYRCWFETGWFNSQAYKYFPVFVRAARAF